MTAPVSQIARLPIAPAEPDMTRLRADCAALVGYTLVEARALDSMSQSAIDKKHAEQFNVPGREVEGKSCSSPS